MGRFKVLIALTNQAPCRPTGFDSVDRYAFAALNGDLKGAAKSFSLHPSVLDL